MGFAEKVPILVAIVQLASSEKDEHKTQLIRCSHQKYLYALMFTWSLHSHDAWLIRISCSVILWEPSSP